MKAIRYLKKLGMSNVEAYERKLSRMLIDEMARIEGPEYIGPAEDRAALIAFRLKGYNKHNPLRFC